MTSPAVPPRNPRGTRTGFTTGACAAAAAKAAARFVVQGIAPASIETLLPNRTRVTFPVHRALRLPSGALCSVIKDAGDDPDCTHGAELVAEVFPTKSPGLIVTGGSGVARVTKPGLGLEVGTSAITPVPHQNIAEMVATELEGSAFSGAHVVISVPGGEAMAEQTTNARLGLLGGISILGTTGIVKPYSTAAFRASVVHEIEVARAQDLSHLILTTGGKSEEFAMRIFPHFPENAFIQVGDFVGVGLRHCARSGLRRATIVGMIGKLSKMAMGKMQTHAAGSQVDTDFLASLARRAGGDEALELAVRAANTARHVLELVTAAGLVGFADLIAAGVCHVGNAHVAGTPLKGALARPAQPLEIECVLVDFNGSALGRADSVSTPMTLGLPVDPGPDEAGSGKA